VLPRIRQGIEFIQLPMPGAMLMLIREYVRPLPVGPGEDATDLVTGDVQETVRMLRRTDGSLGLQG
jgi:hypothetical protein